MYRFRMRAKALCLRAVQKPLPVSPQVRHHRPAYRWRQILGQGRQDRRLLVVDWHNQQQRLRNLRGRSQHGTWVCAP